MNVTGLKVINDNDIKIYIPVKGKKVFVIKSNLFTKIIKYSLTKEGNQMLSDEYSKYQIIKRNNASNKYYFEDFNQIITLENVLFPSIITLNIIDGNKTYNINIDSSILYFCEDDAYYYTESNKSENIDENDDIIKKNKYIYNNICDEFVIKKIKFIICDYDKTKLTIDNYIYKNQNVLNDHINIFSSILSKLEILYDEQHFIHGDFKLDNILLKEKVPYFYDLEFSIFMKKNTIRIENKVIPRVNLYLSLANGIILTKEFLHIFDYYLFTITIYAYYVEMKYANIVLKLIEEEAKRSNQQHMLIFHYIYKRIYNYFDKNNKTKITVETMLQFCDYTTIRKIIKSKAGLMGLLTNSPEYQIQRIYNIIYDLNSI